MKASVKKIEIRECHRKVLTNVAGRNRIVVLTAHQSWKFAWVASLKTPTKSIIKLHPRTVASAHKKGLLEEIPIDKRYFKMATTTFYIISERGRLVLTN